MRIKLETEDIDGNKVCSHFCPFISFKQEEKHFLEGYKMIANYNCRYAFDARRRSYDMKRSPMYQYVEYCLPGDDCPMSKLPAGFRIFELKELDNAEQKQ